MKEILITGTKSCVGMCVEKWLMQWPDKYRVVTLDMQNETWREHDFSKYDSVFHVAGIAHVILDPSMEDLFYSVNRDMAIDTAIHAKRGGVKQFIFMSSGIVYGDSSHIGQPCLITKDTKPKPANFYGKSKLQGEQGIQALADQNFKVVIIRSPALYGIGMKSHYNNLSNFAKKHYLFPDIKNERSMLYNKNLAEFVRLMIENQESGIFWPQNAEYINTAKVIKDIADEHGRTLHLVPFLNPIFRLSAKFIPAIDKAFGSFAYDQKLSDYKENYRIYNYKDSIKEIETSKAKLLIEKLM